MKNDLINYLIIVWAGFIIFILFFSYLFVPRGFYSNYPGSSLISSPYSSYMGVCTPAQKQAKICTLDWNPVCGDDGRTYGNACMACASGEVSSWIRGACAGFENCSLDPDTGPCRGYFIKYYFNQTTGSCEEFVWGGCQGAVPFDLLEECRQACE